MEIVNLKKDDEIIEVTLHNDLEMDYINLQRQYNDVHYNLSTNIEGLNTIIKAKDEEIQALKDELLMYQNQSTQGANAEAELMEANKSVKEFKAKMMVLLGK